MFTRKSIFFAVILIALLIIGSCSSGGSEKKPADQEKQNLTGQQQTPTGEQPAEEPPVTTAGDQGEPATTVAEGGIAVTEEGGVTKVYDSEGNVVANQTGLAGASTQTGASGSGPAQPPDSSVKKEIKTRGDVNINNKIAIIKTNFGDLYVFFYPEIAPTHVRNFIYLAEKGFFMDTMFHRIMKGFMAQGGKPRADWTEPIPAMRLEVRPGSNAIHVPGAFSAARTSDPNSATSQFFLVFTREKAKHLDNQYTVFGQVFKGLDILKKIEGIKLAPNPEMGGEMSKPMQDVKIIDVVIEDAGKYQPEISKAVADNAKILEKEGIAKTSSGTD